MGPATLHQGTPEAPAPHALPVAGAGPSGSVGAKLQQQYTNTHPPSSEQSWHRSSTAASTSSVSGS
eukprot:CAMPEP_0173388726 /NCGR_PEP_ID=MMETSP1356-20130122/10966_1 /TAXON_ID=77927 ORGANISM="Hemiselmis virescens, Strain PCC157" /NCGR_SAMPLE_ID=MMETSP1356 /ASSEMBLY_ACC=CAM_ASM_000847 /LENGTH=65 /DNA_ID=CAMNT_0014345705 /DNA_START=774 /DNA_END=967 /DNA_ORIENTATION=+